MQRNCILCKTASWGTVRAAERCLISVEGRGECLSFQIQINPPHSSLLQKASTTSSSSSCVCSPPYPLLWALDLRPDLTLFLRPTVFSQFLSPSSNHHHSISYLCQPRPTGGQGHRGHLGSWQDHEYHMQGQKRFTLPCSQPPPSLPGPLQPPNNPNYTFLAHKSGCHGPSELSSDHLWPP